MSAHATPVAVELVAVALALGLALVHLYGRRLRVLDHLPRSRWLSVAGGVSVAYVFVHVLPEIGRASTHVGPEPFGLAFLEHHVYLVALVGFLAYYGVERAAKRSTRDPDADAGGGLRVFWMHVLAFALYNLLVGYLLLHREESGLASLVLFGVAMALHFLVNDWALRQHHGDAYHARGRWVLAAAVLFGLGVGFAVPIGRQALAVLFAFLAGGVILNVIKEEVPEERESRFSAFALGAAGYTAVLLLV
ncbi:hypothetical protein EFA46_012430 (plasmid) [Halarchaeum sp. CBA1220]|uniref:hypothetical protein n=1 Tax=Halarchaeum sp. CBA1220 TaxID=1853682 RepID=UPI000F3A8107|nr:hypothetical protein [Halarchaeum sp. CBA1220]QLC35057.1 hypothetical protein EFA46_012430 [Halarchaeum sp. CBA1220]